VAIQVSPQNVVGRDELIERVWHKLENNSLRFTAERRIGKTTVMTKMEAEPKAGYLVLFMELEGIDSADSFAELLVNRVMPLLSGTVKAKSRWDSFRESIGGVEVGGVIKLPESNIGWQATLEKTLEGVCGEHKNKKILLLMDELPYMLQKMATIAGSDVQRTVALTLLDTLRSIRQKNPNIRMIYAGSVGLHHVLTDLKQEKLASEPVNDMPSVEIHGLKDSNAAILAERLLVDENVGFDENDKQAILDKLVFLTDGVPFYIEAVCSRLGELCGQISVTHVVDTVQEGVDIPEKRLAIALLDFLATATESRSIEEVWSAIKSQFQITDRQQIVQMLKSLALDHYLISDTNKRYSFRFPLIQKWWLVAQGLEG